MIRYAVTPLDPSDAASAEAIHDVMVAAYAVEAAVIGAADFPPLRRSVADIAASDARFFGILVAGIVAAVAEVERQEPGHIDVAALVVLPSFFRRGMAGALLRSIAEAYPSDAMIVSTGVRNLPALRLYAAHGFVEHRRWTTGDGFPMVTLRRE